MAKPGPKPKPAALKKLAGNPGKRPLNEEEPSPELASPRVPYGLDDEAKKFWRKMAPQLIEQRVLTKADIPAFILMATHYSIAQAAAEILAEDGIKAVDERGLVRKHPLLQVLRDNSTAFRMYAAEFGLTPSSRSGVQRILEEESDELTLIIRKRYARRTEDERD